jgi:hypothetical protein
MMTVAEATKTEEDVECIILLLPGRSKIMI